MKRISKENLKDAGVILVMLLLFIGGIYFAVNHEAWGAFWCALFLGLGMGIIGERHFKE
jgi:hypothetical protein